MPGQNILGKCGSTPSDIRIPSFNLFNVQLVFGGTRTTTTEYTTPETCSRTLTETLSGSFSYSHTRMGAEDYINNGAQLNDLTFVFYTNGCCVGDLWFDNWGSDDYQQNGTYQRSCETDCTEIDPCSGQDVTLNNQNLAAVVTVGFSSDYKKFNFSGQVIFSGIWTPFFSTDDIAVSEMAGTHVIEIEDDGWTATLTINLTT